ncbi:MAG: DUF2277 domain-containing protein [Saprospiraceae bacterium]|nr:DUF2277 domain-containing protein [Saprospiraceae bacterium]
MCRNIRTLFNFEPPATDEEIYASALQYVRKVSGSNTPSKANEALFYESVDKISNQIRYLLDHMTTLSTPKNREEEREKARERNLKRFGS